MPKRQPSDEERAQFLELMSKMTKARLEIFGENAAKYAEVLGTFRTALEKSGFSPEESMQIVLKVAEQPGQRPFFGGHGRWHKDKR